MAACAWFPGRSSAIACFFLAVALLDRPRRGALDEVERAVGGGGGSVHGVVDVRPRAAHDRLELGPVGLGALDRRLHELERERDRLVDELHRLEQPVGEAELDRVLRLQQPVLAERVRDDELDRRLRPDEARRELRAAPGGEEAEEDLGEAEVPDGAGDRARRAVQRELEAAAEARAVDRRDRREGQRPDAQEELVAGAAALAGRLRRDLRELVDVRPGAEPERLAREDGRHPVARLELREQRLPGLERRAAERRRLRPVLAVVDRDEREPSGLRLHGPEVEDGVRHVPTPPPRPCRGRCRAP